MDKKQIEKMINNLDKIKEKNNKKSELREGKYYLAKLNKFEDKAFTIFIWSMLVYFVFILITFKIGINNIINIFPGLSYPTLFVGGSIGIGTIINTLINKKYKIKEKFKSFSVAKTEAEKLEEEVKYQIEYEKINNKNRVIEESIKILKSNRSLLNNISINIIENSQIEEDKKEELSDFLREQYTELDILSAQKILSDRFRCIRSTFDKMTNLILSPLAGAASLMLIVALPVIIVSGNVLPGVGLNTTLGSFVVGSIIGPIYMLKRTKDYKKAFNNLNNQLGENALTDKLKLETGEKIEIEKKIENMIATISLVEVELQKQICLDEEEHLSQLEVTEKTKEDVLEYPEKYADCDVRIRTGKFYTEEEKEKYIEESLSRPLPGEEKGPILVKRKSNNSKK